MKTGGVSTFGASVLQILIEERLENIAAKLQRRIAIPFQRAEVVGVVIYLAVTPGSHDEVVVIGLALGLQRR